MNRESKTQRIGNYYVKIKQGTRNQFVNVVPYYKLYRRAAAKGIFGNILDFLKAKFAKYSK